jgi:hypothetical protein
MYQKFSISLSFILRWNISKEAGIRITIKRLAGEVFSGPN